MSIECTLVCILRIFKSNTHLKTGGLRYEKLINVCSLTTQYQYKGAIDFKLITQ